jgi:hypothetical protein
MADRSSLKMRPDVKLILIGVSAIAVASPFATIGVLAAIARFRKANLRPTLRWLRASRWATWLIGAPFVAVGLASHQLSLCFPFGMSMITASGGLTITENWVKRRYAPELLPTEDGWWPTERK